MTRIIDDLSPKEFEQLTYDLVRSSGFRSITWRTPGSDTGRDIEAKSYTIDPSGFELAQKWYIECKRYNTSVSWPVVFQKVSFAKNHDADFLLMVSNNNPSPACESEIVEWNRREKLKIRFWRGYEISSLLLQHPSVGLAHGLIDADSGSNQGFLPITLISLKLNQLAMALNETGKDASHILIASSQISELIFQRLHDLSRIGRPVIVKKNVDQILLDSDIPADLKHYQFDEITLRLLLDIYKIFTTCQEVTIECVDNEFQMRAVDARTPLTEKTITDLEAICVWSGIELNIVNNSTISLKQR